ncbi:MAG: hypothetical protein AAF518_19140 [Spirochaetota bacterium]
MKSGDKISDRQIELIQGSANILMEELYLSKEEALQLISDSLKQQLQESNVTFAFLELSGIPARQAFVRNLVYRVETKINASFNLPKEKIKKAIDRFVKLFRDSLN